MSNSPFTPSDDQVTPEQTDDAVIDESPEMSPDESSEEPVVLLEDKEISYTNPNVTREHDAFLPLDESKSPKIKPVPLAAFNHTNHELTNFEESTFLKLADANSFDEKWRQTVALADSDSLISDNYTGSLAREDSDWQQSAEYEGTKLKAARPRLSANNEGGVVSGIKALTKMQGLLGIGAMIEVPLWNSGIWVSIKAPSDIELLNLYETTQREKIELGKSSVGLLYTNSSTYVNKHLFDLIVDLIYETSIKDYTPDMLGDVIKMNDLPILCWALACNMYPNGYPYNRSCVIDTSKCQKTVEALLDIGKLLWVDRSRLNAKQLKHMQRIPRVKRTLKEIEAYQDEFAEFAGGSYISESGYTAVLKQPSLNDHLEMGENWIDSMNQTVRDTFSDERAQSNINQYIEERASLTILRNYGHYIKHFVFPDGSKVVDRAGIESLLNELTSVPDEVTGIIDAVKSYIDKSAVAMLAVPRNPCPNCGQEPTYEIEKSPWLLPLDGQRLFFRLQDRRLQQGIPA